MFQKTPLHLALVDKKGADIVSALVDFGADVDLSDKDKQNPLHFAAKYCSDVDVVGLMMESSLSSDKETLLELCLSYNSNIDVVKLLMSEYDINVVSKTKLQILLHSAAKNNTIVEVIQVLIKAGADVKAKDKNDLTSLEFTAINNPSAHVLRMLIVLGLVF